MSDLTNIRDLLTAEDALDMEERFDATLREHNEHEDHIGELHRNTIQREVFDWELDVPEEFWY